MTTIAEHSTKRNQWITQTNPIYGVVFLIIVVGLAAEIYINSDPDRLDWIDWWFWARQNLFQLTESGQFMGIVMSPVQGLFGQSYPVSPFFHPLWAIAANIDDPKQAHGIVSSLVFFLYSATIWFVATRFIQNRLFVLATAIVCLNLFFDVVPVTEIYPLPKSNFDYFVIVPPHNYIFFLAMAVFVISVTAKPSIWKVVANLGVITLSVLADPLHTVVYFFPIIILIGIYYLFEITNYTKEILLTLLGIAFLYFLGIFEYPLLLKESIGRSVFNEYLFHHVKRHDDATFAFQNKQNIIFIVISSGLLIWNSIVKSRHLSGSVLAIQVLFLVTGFVYLATNLNLYFFPGLHVMESTVVPIYVIVSMHALENLVQSFGEKIKLLLLWTTLGCLAIFVLGKAITIDLTPYQKVESFSQEKLLTEKSTDTSMFSGSTTFLLGTRGSEFSRSNGLEGPFSMKHMIFTQNNEHTSEFLGKYGYSASLISYWLNGIPTLEENNHMTSPFYIYFFRNLFMRSDDYYVTNQNHFTHPRLHLYPMLGVHQLVSDIPTKNSQKFALVDEIFYKTEFKNYNYGQYSPKKAIGVSNAREAVVVMGDPSFDPIREYIILNEDLLNSELNSVSSGRINYERNAIRFEGETEGKTLHVLPIIFSNCLNSSAGNSLIRVNLLLTGILFTGQTSDRISYRGPPFNNNCLKEDILDIKRFSLRDREYAYPLEADRPAIKKFLASPWH